MVTKDSDDNKVKYGWEWDGNSVIDEWSYFVHSDTIDQRNNSWSEPETYYDVKVKTMDTPGGISGWSPSLQVTILPYDSDLEVNAHLI